MGIFKLHVLKFIIILTSINMITYANLFFDRHSKIALVVVVLPKALIFACWHTNRALWYFKLH